MRPSLPALFHHMRVSRCCLCSDLLNADFAVLNMTTLGTWIILIMWKGIMSGPRVLADVLRKKRRHLLKVFTINHEKKKATVCLIEFWEIDLIYLNLLIQYDGKIKALSVRFCLAVSLCVPWHTSIISSNSYLSLLSGSDGERVKVSFKLVLWHSLHYEVVLTEAMCLDFKQWGMNV